jgi:hypothetical protein
MKTSHKSDELKKKKRGGGCPPLNDQVNDINLVPKMGHIIKVHRPVSSAPISGLYHRPLLAACKWY